MGNITLLNVDGNRRTRAARTAVLGRGAFRVVEAADGRAALETLRKHADGPVLVLLRGDPPDIGASELCRTLRDNATAPLFLVRLRGPAAADADAAEADACLRDHYRQPEWLSTIEAYARLLERQAADRRCIEGLQAELAEREAALERLRQEREERLCAAGEAAQVGTWWVDLETGLESRDAGVNRILGLPAKPSLAPTVTGTSRIPPEDRPRIEAAFRRLNTEGGAYDEEFRILLPDGSLRWVRDRGRIVSGAGGRPLYATGALVDITERKKSEETIRRLNETLRRKIDDFEALLEFAPVSIVVAEDPEGRRLRMNPAFERLVGLESGPNPWFDDDPERLPKCRFLRHGRELGEGDFPLVRAMRAGRPVENFEIDIEFPDGRVVNQLGHAVPLFDEAGRVRGATAVALDVTAHKRAERELRRQTEILQKIFENIPVMIDFVDAEGRFQFVNRCWTDTLGWPLEEVRGRNLFDEFYPDPGYRAYVLDFIRNPPARFADFEVRTRDGRTLQTSWANVKLSDGTSIGIGIDVTERRRAEAALKFDRALLDALHTAAPVGIAFVDREFRYLRVNQAYAEITGVPVEQHLGRTVRDIVPDLWTRLEEVYRRVLKRGEVAANLEVAGETRAQPGVRRHWLANYYPLTVAGEIVAAGAVIQDITGQKRSEAALRDSERRLELALEGADLGSWDWNLRTGEMLINDRWARVFGGASDTLVTDYEGWLSQVHPDDRARVLEILEAHLTNQLAFYEAEYRFLLPSGQWIWAMVRGRVLERDEAGKPVRVVGMYRDISVRKALEERLQQQRDQILHVQRLTTAGELVAMVAHELNQPLGAIANYLGGAILRFGDLLAAHPSLAEALNEALRVSKRASQVVKGIRDLVRGRGQPREWVSIHGLIHDSLLLAQAEFRKRRIKLVLDVPKTLPPVWGQKVHLQQLLLNLALNAVEAMEATPPERRELRIRAELVGEHEIELSLGDRGPGLPAELAPRLFEPFVTSKPEGIGLGLSICRSIVETHGGRIEADPPSELGATFRIRLPAGTVGGT
jgi:PAS domain S-box-containing protein